MMIKSIITAEFNVLLNYFYISKDRLSSIIGLEIAETKTLD